MAKTKTGRHTSAMKEARKNVRRKEQNRVLKRKVKSEIKKLKKAVAEKSPDVSKIYSEVQSLLDKAAKKNVYHKNKSSRIKSRLSDLIKNI